MICEFCKKNPASIHIQEIVNDERKMVHICAECANSAEIRDELMEKFSLPAFLNPLSQLAGGGAIDFEKLGDAPSAKTPDVTCSSCGLTSKQVQEKGNLGCPDCYNAFEMLLAEMIPMMQRDGKHVGRRPTDADPGNPSTEGHHAQLDVKLEVLERELQDALSVENYEQAARIRDQISAIQAQEAALHETH